MLSEGILPFYATADAVVFSDRCELHWIVVTSKDNKDGLMTLRDGHDSDDEVACQIRATRGRSFPFRFDPPMRFKKGLFADMDADLVSYCIGASPGWKVPTNPPGELP